MGIIPVFWTFTLQCFGDCFELNHVWITFVFFSTKFRFQVYAFFCFADYVWDKFVVSEVNDYQGSAKNTLRVTARSKGRSSNVTFFITNPFAVYVCVLF